jgi:hypothetical protein
MRFNSLQNIPFEHKANLKKQNIRFNLLLKQIFQLLDLLYVPSEYFKAN